MWRETRNGDTRRKANSHFWLEALSLSLLLIDPIGCDFSPSRRPWRFKRPLWSQSRPITSFHLVRTIATSLDLYRSLSHLSLPRKVFWLVSTPSRLIHHPASHLGLYGASASALRHCLVDRHSLTLQEGCRSIWTPVSKQWHCFTLSWRQTLVPLSRLLFTSTKAVQGTNSGLLRSRSRLGSSEYGTAPSTVQRRTRTHSNRTTPRC